MNTKPYVTYLSRPLETQQVDSVVSKCYVNEAGQVSFGVFQTKSIAAKKLWQDPEYRAKQSEARKEQHQNAEFHIKQSAAAKKKWRDPEYRAKQSAIMKKL